MGETVSECLFLAFSELEKQKKKAHELHKGLDADYYGFCDDDDGLLEPLEQAQEKKSKELFSSFSIPILFCSFISLLSSFFSFRFLFSASAIERQTEKRNTDR